MTSTTLDLPLHPTMRHPLTGQPLRALHVDKHGRARWPIMGGAPEDPPADPPKQDDPPADPPKQDPPKDDPPKQDPPKQDDLGFPADTPVRDMKPEERAAYHQFHSRKHEQRASEYREAAGGLTAEQVREALAERDELKRKSMTDHERQVEDAKRETRESAAREYGLKAARTALEFALGHDPEKGDEHDHSDLIETIDLSKVLTDSGDVDTAKVRKLVGKIAPADKDKGGDVDFGGGRRGSSRSESSVKSGAERYAQRRGQKAAASTT